MIVVFYIVAIVVLIGFTMKSYATKPYAFDLRELTQTKSEPKEAIQLTRDVVGVLRHSGDRYLP